MSSRTAVPVDFSHEFERAQKRIEHGEFASLDEVARAGLRALDREDDEHQARLRARIAASIADPRPTEAIDEVFARLHAHHEQQVKRGSDGA